VCELTGRNISFVPNENELDSIPYPAFDLMKDRQSISLLTTRGCPYQCTYCASSVLNGSFRKRDVVEVLDEIVYWTGRYPVKNISFCDDSLADSTHARFVCLLKGIIERNIQCNFHTPNGLHVGEITKEVAALLFEAGFSTVRLGFETADETRQIQTGGKTNNLQFEKAVRHLGDAGYLPDNIGVYLMVGLPGQSADEVRKSIQFVRDCGARPYLAEYSPIPATKLWKDALKASPFDLEKEPLLQNNSILPCRSSNLSWEDLYALKGEVNAQVSESSNEWRI
jgi:radical SAM superfamily enzyme YgiQ (UPF0313 family)